MVKKSASSPEISSNSYQKLKKSQKNIFTGKKSSQGKGPSQAEKKKKITDFFEKYSQTQPSKQKRNSQKRKRSSTTSQKQSTTSQQTSQSYQNKKKEAQRQEDINRPNVELERSKIAPGYYRPVKEQTIFEWTQMSRPYKEKNRSFLKSVLVISSLLIIIAILINKVLIAAVIASIAFLTYVLNVVPPDKSQYEITTHGIKVDDKLYSWAILTRFWSDRKNGMDIICVECLVFPNRLTLVIDKKDKKRLTALLEEVLLNQKPKENFYDKIVSWFQDKFYFE